MSEDEVRLVSCAIEKEKASLQKLSSETWRNPELCYEEVRAHSVLTKALRNYGFKVQEHYLLETAFRAEFSSGTDGGPTVAVLCEYDALPEMGHACGHNLIAETGVAAALGIKSAMEADASISGKVVVLGCPAEEGGGGKIRLIEKGAFQDIDVALMAHPGSNNRLVPLMLCKLSVKVTYHGKEAHASGYPWEGRNALDAAVAAYLNVGLLRQHIKPNCRIHGIITNGGAAPNVIPGKTELLFFIRAPTRRDLDELKGRVRACFESAATATGCEVDCDFDEPNIYLNIISNRVLISVFREYSETLGVKFVDEEEARNQLAKTSGSSDMGNVSYVVPSIHPGFRICRFGIHTPDFAKEANTEEAHQAARNTAKALSLTALKLLKSPEVLLQCKSAFKEDIAMIEPLG